MGAWNFSFSAVTRDAERLRPRASCTSLELDGDTILKIDFGAPDSLPQNGFQHFKPPYFEDVVEDKPGNSVELICSPQSETYCTPAGDITVTAYAGCNNVLTFYNQKKVDCNLESFFYSGVRAEKKAGKNSLSLQLQGLPEAKYLFISYHRCDSGKLEEPLKVSINNKKIPQQVQQNAGDTYANYCVNEMSFKSTEKEPVCITFESRVPIICNGFEIKRNDS